MKRRIFVIIFMALLGMGLPGCGGGGAELKSETTTESSTQTLGQELIDLRKAYDMGIISEGEYNEAKEKIIEKRTRTEE